MTEYPPPWIVFPHLGPNEPPTQGAEEAYIHREWLPFWRTLDTDARARYLRQWEATAEWRDVIAERYDPEGFDIDEDASDSAAWMASGAHGGGSL